MYDIFDDGLADDDAISLPLSHLVSSWRAQEDTVGFTTIASWAIR